MNSKNTEYGKFEFSGIRCFNNLQDFTLSNNFTITTSNYRPTGTYAAVKQSSTKVRVQNFALKIIDTDELQVYELDLVKFVPRQGLDSEAKGVVCYNQRKYMWVIEDLLTHMQHPLYECKIKAVIGSMLDPSLAGQQSTQTDPADTGSVAADEPDCRYAALNEPIPGIDDIPKPSKPQKDKNPATHVYVTAGMRNGQRFWCYHLVSSSGKTKTLQGDYKNNNEENQFYQLSSIVIALAALKNPKQVVLHTPYGSLNKMISLGNIMKIDPQTWVYKNGKKPREVTKRVMQDLQNELSRINAEIKVEIITSAEVFNKAAITVAA